MIYLSYLATFLVLSGVYYIGKPNILGQYLMLGADLTWALYASLTGQWALLAQSIVLLGLSLRAIYNWKKHKIGVSK